MSIIHTQTNDINKLIQQLPEDQKNYISDGYHTFKELYDHRVTLFIALCNIMDERDSELGNACTAWKSKLHSDGTMWDGWYIAGIGTEPGHTLTYHLPIDTWDSLKSQELKNAPEWDGHKSEDVLELLKKLY